MSLLDTRYLIQRSNLMTESSAPEPDAAQYGSSRQRIVSLLRDDQYQRAWIFGGLTGITRWLELLALGIYAYEVTGSPFLVALLPILRMLPLTLFGAVTGALADRFDRRDFLLASVVLVLAITGVMAWISWTGAITFTHVAIASFLSGLFWTTDMPVRRRIIGDIAGPDRLSQAMGLDAATNNLTRMIGPLIGGVLYQTLGLTGVFILSAVTYALSFLLVLGLRSSDDAAPSEEEGVLEDHGIAAGLRTLRDALGDPHLRRLLAVTVVFNVWGFPFISMLPVIGKSTFGLDPSRVGLISSLEGLGSFIGALVFAFILRPSMFLRAYVWSTAAYVALIACLGVAGYPALAAALLIVIGLASAGFQTMQSTLFYLAAPPKMRSRIFGLLTICIGAGPFGFLNVGLMAEKFGAEMALLITGVEGAVVLLLIAIPWTELRRPGG
jgi:predicted MFS family arabinose efflux permease